jgi:repressor LexA
MTTSLIIRASRARLVDLEPIPFEAVEDNDLQTVPLLGTVSAGEPIDIYELAEELELPASWVSKNTFALRVRGDSMIDDHIQDGDVIIVEQRTYADNGETVVARINGEQATLKKLY